MPATGHASLSVTSATAAAQEDRCEKSINQCIYKLQNTTSDSYLVRCFVLVFVFVLPKTGKREGDEGKRSSQEFQTNALGPLEGKHHFELEPSGSV